MSTLTTVASLHATRTGCAEPIATVRHQHLDDNPFVLIPLTLAGEACAPLAAMAGTDRDDPVLLTVRQPRNIAERFQFAQHLAALLLPYLDGCRSQSETYFAGRGKEERSRVTRAPQILVPNGEGIAYLSLLGRLTRLRSTEGPYAVAPSVPLLGKWLTWAADRAEFPNTSILLAMTRLLAAHWVTGQSSAEDSHLASLLAWIEPHEGLTGAQSAREAEDPTCYPPAGPATDPAFDRTLYELMAHYGEAPTDGARESAARQIDAELRGQLMPTWRQMWRGIDLIRALPKGGHVDRRWERDREAFTSYATYLEEDGRPQARRDHAVGAARRLARLEEAQAEYQVQCAYDDPLVMAEYELTGEAFTGAVVDRDPDRLDLSGKTPKRRPTITLRTEERPDVVVGTVVRSPARSSQAAEVLGLTDLPDGACEALLQVTSGLGRGYKQPLPPGAVPEVGEQLTYTTLSPNGVPSRLPATENTPWTHGGPPQPYQPSTEDAEETWE
ncbi:hypothetical protein [Streptomyces sp. NBC_01477]|uniref:hypothetical protein n=1 Tax=Streptomyces sp. NBC_01477 TaxID=2976015 RepID=UPI002E33AD67|nr:hypothetical protein [Streptomyces sp. NBC_01477]